MKSLPNGCSRSELTVSPTNWKTKKANISKPWRIVYRFYDPAYKGTKLWGKQFPIKGMNAYHTLEERQNLTQALIDSEIDLLDVQGYNPITGLYFIPADTNIGCGRATPDSTLMAALRSAMAYIDISPDTLTNMRSVLKYFEMSATMLGINNHPISEVKRKDIRAILDNCGNILVVDKDGNMIPKIWNASNFNFYRSYLKMLYNQLVEWEVVEYNCIEGIAKRKADPIDPDKKKAKVLTDQQRLQVDEKLKSDPKLHTFRRFVHIFFHSGARRVELLKVQGKNVDLKGQRFKVLVKKGKVKRWVWKTIKDVALPWWAEAVQNCNADDYVFSVGLEPGAKPIRSEQVTRRWKRHIKSLGIAPNLYRLKHLNTTEMVELFGDTTAARHNDHTTNAMVVNIYDVKRDQRDHETIRKAGNSFA